MQNAHRTEFSIHYRHAVGKWELFLVQWLIRVAMAISNTYVNKTKCKQVLKRKKQPHWELPSFWIVLEALAAVSTPAQWEGMVAVENGPGETSLRLSGQSALQKCAVAELLEECAHFILKIIITVILHCHSTQHMVKLMGRNPTLYQLTKEWKNHILTIHSKP